MTKDDTLRTGNPRTATYGLPDLPNDPTAS